MNYRTASKQQLLAERARLQSMYRKAEQRVGPAAFTTTVGGGSTRRNRGSTRAPQNEVQRLAEQLEQLEVELKRRENEAGGLTEAPGTEIAGE